MGRARDRLHGDGVLATHGQRPDDLPVRCLVSNSRPPALREPFSSRCMHRTPLAHSSQLCERAPVAKFLRPPLQAADTRTRRQAPRHLDAGAGRDARRFAPLQARLRLVATRRVGVRVHPRGTWRARRRARARALPHRTPRGLRSQHLTERDARARLYTLPTATEVDRGEAPRVLRRRLSHTHTLSRRWRKRTTGRTDTWASCE